MPARAFLLIAILFSVFSSPTRAADNHLTVQDLYYVCKGKDEPTLMLCSGFIGGIGEMMYGLGTQIADDPRLRMFAICGTISHGAMIQAFLNWAEKHPEKWGQPQLIGVMTSLIETWPCPEPKK